jgi:hypothetical protein
VGDTLTGSPLITDEEIMASLSARPNIYFAAAEVALSIRAAFGRQVQTTTGPSTSANLNQRSEAYRMLSVELYRQGVRSGVTPYSGGTSRADVQSFQTNTDIPRPFFARGQYAHPGTVDWGGIGQADGEGGWMEGQVPSL